MVLILASGSLIPSCFLLICRKNITVITHSSSNYPGFTEGTFPFFKFLFGPKGLSWTSTKTQNIELEEDDEYHIDTLQFKTKTYACFFSLLVSLVDG